MIIKKISALGPTAARRDDARTPKFLLVVDSPDSRALYVVELLARFGRAPERVQAPTVNTLPVGASHVP